MVARSLLAVLALACLGACHRRVFEDKHARDEVMVTSTTVITNADVPPPAAEPATAATDGAAAALVVPAMPSEPLPQAPSEADRTATNLGMGDAGASTAATPPAPASPPAAPAERPPEPPPYHAPSAADPIPWAGDTYVPNP